MFILLAVAGRMGDSCDALGDGGVRGKLTQRAELQKELGVASAAKFCRPGAFAQRSKIN